MSCLTALDSQIVSLLSVPHEILFLQHKVFREYAKIAVGPDFIHTLPSFLILTSMAIVLWRNPPCCNGLAESVASTMVYKGLQLLVSWVVAIAVFWLWLMMQRLLYCCVWTSWGYESEYRDVSYQWWQQVWSSYYPPPSQPPAMSAGLISWLISMSIATTVLGCAISANRVCNLVTESMAGAKDALVIVKRYAKSCFKSVVTSVLQLHWPQQEPLLIEKKMNAPMNDSEASCICDECRSEISSDLINESRREILPISYGTNWMPKPSFSGYKDAQRKASMKSLHTVAVVNDIQDSDDLSPRQLRYKRGCHTVIPNNSSDQSSGC
ncbi:uncharacterized protein LOC122573911 [Bombus pyrosoma]|uniref:uncharacterized protein LOC122573911 n=1 Tax=Bombus pyrosoma TaxID=396416 RepID=UPI001CB98D8E|nr:uncharacterized protein LOC122573911 [Bombus pyrosoma]